MTERLELRTFVAAVLDRVESAAGAGNRDEVVRLLDVLRDAVNDEARRLEREAQRAIQVLDAGVADIVETQDKG